MRASPLATGSLRGSSGPRPQANSHLTLHLGISSGDQCRIQWAARIRLVASTRHTPRRSILISNALARSAASKPQSSPSDRTSNSTSNNTPNHNSRLLPTRRLLIRILPSLHGGKAGANRGLACPCRPSPNNPESALNARRSFAPFSSRGRGSELLRNELARLLPGLRSCKHVPNCLNQAGCIVVE
jgi:hypothetical protein